LATQPFVGYVGPDPGSAVSLAKQIPKLLALSASVCGVQTEVSLEVVWEGAGTRFLHPRDVLMKSWKFKNRSYVLPLCNFLSFATCEIASV